MSNISASQELDFWEFVNCGICHLEFVKENGVLSSVPFWLTECGHVVCNSHINPDHSCSECGSQGVQLMPLARELEPPMSHWFTSAPLAFDAVGYSLRFQMNMMANLLRYFRKKYMQYRPLYDRLKEEHTETKRLRKLIDQLNLENQQLRQQLQINVADERTSQSNKRRRVDEDVHYSGHGTSSPRSTMSVSTPLGPDRLTLPPSHQQPHFNSRQSLQTHERSVSQQNIAQYAYVPPRSAQPSSMPVPVLTHTQSGPMRRVQAMEGASQDSRMMPPPALPNLSDRLADPRSMLTTGQPATSSGVLRRPSFLPSPSANGSQRFVPQTPSKSSATVAPTANSRPFVLTPQHKAQQTQRFLPSGLRSSTATASVGSGLAISAGTVSQAVSRSPSMAMSGSGGQRAPFVPGGAN